MSAGQSAERRAYFAGRRTARASLGEIARQQNKKSISCPHAANRIKAFTPDKLAGAPASFTTRDWKGKEVAEGSKMRVQAYADDCTGCGVCVGQCPAAAKGALSMVSAQ